MRRPAAAQAIFHLTHLKISNVLILFLDCHTIGKRLLLLMLFYFVDIHLVHLTCHILYPEKSNKQTISVQEVV